MVMICGNILVLVNLGNLVIPMVLMILAIASSGNMMVVR